MIFVLRFLLILVSIENTKAVFDHISKHFEGRQKYSNFKLFPRCLKMCSNTTFVYLLLFRSCQKYILLLSLN